MRLNNNKEIISYVVFDMLYYKERYLKLSRVHIGRRQNVDVGILISSNSLLSIIQNEIK
jgi:hypothetical protein